MCPNRLRVLHVCVELGLLAAQAGGTRSAHGSKSAFLLGMSRPMAREHTAQFQDRHRQSRFGHPDAERVGTCSWQRVRSSCSWQPSAERLRTGFTNSVHAGMQVAPFTRCAGALLGGLNAVFRQLGADGNGGDCSSRRCRAVSRSLLVSNIHAISLFYVSLSTLRIVIVRSHA